MHVRWFRRWYQTYCFGMLVLLCAAVTVSAQEQISPQWPNWRGPFGNGAATPFQAELVDDLHKAKLLWRSEDLIPNGDDSRGVGFTGGYGSPMVANDTVVLQYFLGAGKLRLLHDPKPIRGAQDLPAYEAWMQARACVFADDIIHAFDRFTGKTKWIVRHPDGFNHNTGSQKGGGHYLPVCVDGMVVALGTSGKLFAVNIADGSVLWSRSHGVWGTMMEQERKRLRKSRLYSKAGVKRCNNGLTTAGGLAIVPHMDPNPGKRLQSKQWQGLLAVEPATGKEVWKRYDVAKTGSTAIPWCFSGKEYILSSSTSTICLDARTGETVWKANGVAGFGGGRYGVSVAANAKFLVGPGGGNSAARGEPPAGLFAVCYKITAAGTAVEKHWQLKHGIELGAIDNRSPCIYGDHVYFLTSRHGRGQMGKALVQIDLETGAHVCIEHTAGPSTTSAVVGNGRLLNISGYYGTDSIWDLTGDTPVCLPMKDVPHYATGLSGALVGGLFYYREQTRMSCLDLRK